MLFRVLVLSFDINFKFASIVLLKFIFSVDLFLYAYIVYKMYKF